MAKVAIALDTQPVSPVLNRWLCATTDYWNLLITHSRNEVSTFMLGDGEDDIDVLVNHFSALHEAVFGSREQMQAKISERSWTRVERIKRIPQYILLSRSVDILAKLVEVRKDCQMTGVVGELRLKNPWLPRFKGAKSSRSIRLNDKNFKIIPYEAVVIRVKSHEARLTLKTDQWHTLLALTENTEKALQLVITERSCIYDDKDQKIGESDKYLDMTVVEV